MDAVGIIGLVVPATYFVFVIAERVVQTLLQLAVAVIGLGLEPLVAPCTGYFIAFNSFFRHWNVRTPQWAGYLIPLRPRQPRRKAEGHRLADGGRARRAPPRPPDADLLTRRKRCLVRESPIRGIIGAPFGENNEERAKRSRHPEWSSHRVR